MHETVSSSSSPSTSSGTSFIICQLLKKHAADKKEETKLDHTIYKLPPSKYYKKISNELKLNNRACLNSRKKFVCEVCDKKFTTQEYLRSHSIRHLGEGPKPTLILCGI